MEKSNSSSFGFRKYHVKSSLMEYTGIRPSDTLNMDIKLDANPDFSDCVALVGITLDLKDNAENIHLNVCLEGEFSYENTPSEQRNKFIALNAPAILFPYVRSFVSCLTAQSGMEPIILPTVNLSHLGNEILQKLEKPE